MTASAGPLAIRPATREDVPSVLQLYADDELGTAPDRAWREKLADYLAAFDAIQTDARTTVYVAQLGASVVGTFQLTFLRHLAHRGALTAQVESVHVASEHRRRGIGEAMMRFAIDRAREKNCKRIQLTSQKRRTDAHRFYERLGFERSHEGLKLPLQAGF
jgi:ribosomal protein S18 acetylase RimI-like enzyme